MRSPIIDICNKILGGGRISSMEDIFALPCTMDIHNVRYYMLGGELMLGIDPMMRRGITDYYFTSNGIADSVVVRLNTSNEIVGYKLVSTSEIIIAKPDFDLSSTVDIYINIRSNFVRVNNVRFANYREIVLGNHTFKMPDIAPIISSYKLYGELWT